MHLTLTMEDVEEHASYGSEAFTFDIYDAADGYRYKTVIKPGETQVLTVPAGNYTVKPLSVSRYTRYSLLAGTANVTEISNGAEVDFMSGTSFDETMVFGAERTRWDKYSHTDTREAVIDNSWI